jgi:ActR/RegA family two-component response regulator
MAARRDKSTERNTAVLRFGAADAKELQLQAAIADHVARVLAACSGSISLSAVLLGIPRRTLQRMLARGLRTPIKRRRRA